MIFRSLEDLNLSLYEYKLIYIANEYSFDTLPRPTSIIGSLLINDISLKINVRNMVIGVSGYCPYLNWTRKKVVIPPVDSNSLTVSFEEDEVLMPGVAMRVSEGNIPVYFDAEDGIICIEKSPDVFSTFSPFPGVVLGTNESGCFCSLWLKPSVGLEDIKSGECRKPR